MDTYIKPDYIVNMNFGGNIPEIPKIVYIFFYKSLIKKIESYFEFEKIKFTRGDLYIEKNKKFGIITNFGKGESESLMLAEELSFMGVEKVISIGAVGSLNSNLGIGDKILIESAFSQIKIGEVYDFDKDEVYTNKSLNQKIKKSLIDSGIKFNSVKTLSVPTIYRETLEEIEKAKKKDISVIEMEIFSLAMVFSLRNVEFSALGCVSDVLDSSKGWSFEADFEKVFSSLSEIFLNIWDKINN
ncbi:hypothetical protein KKH36_03040 [Patescibacteria group bacterium]|nr:hypothetical protein [Patescibacteria group bacterium]